MKILQLIKKGVSIQILTVMAIGTVIWQAYDRYGPEMPQITELRKTLADEMVQRIVNEFPRHPSIKTIYVFKFAGDGSEYFTDTLREKLEISNLYRVAHKAWFEKVKDDLRLPEPVVYDLEKALETGREIGVDGVVFGKIDRFTHTDQGADLDVALHFASIGGGDILYSKRYQEGESPAVLSVSGSGGGNHWKDILMKVFFWLIFAAFLPVACTPFIKAVLKKESNLANFLMVAAFTLAGLIFAAAMARFDISGIAVPLFLALAVISGGVYNYWFCNFISELEN